MRQILPLMSREMDMDKEKHSVHASHFHSEFLLFEKCCLELPGITAMVEKPQLRSIIPRLNSLLRTSRIGGSFEVRCRSEHRYDGCIGVPGVCVSKYG